MKRCGTCTAPCGDNSCLCEVPPSCPSPPCLPVAECTASGGVCAGSCALGCVCAYPQPQQTAPARPAADIEQSIGTITNLIVGILPLFVIMMLFKTLRESM